MTTADLWDVLTQASNHGINVDAARKTLGEIERHAANLARESGVDEATMDAMLAMEQIAASTAARGPQSAPVESP